MNRLIRNLAVVLVGAGLIAAPTLAAAQSAEAASEPAKTDAKAEDDQQPPAPTQVAEETVDTVLARLQENREEYKKNPEALYDMIEEVLVPHVDVDYMAKLVLGRHWRSATPEQKDRFAEAFKQMVIQTYGNALYGFDKEQIEYLPVRAEEGAEDITFRAEVTTEKGETVPVTLDMHVVDGQWKVYNGTVGNLSFVTNYRGQFNAQIKAGGLDQLIDKLENRYVQTAANGGDAEPQ